MVVPDPQINSVPIRVFRSTPPDHQYGPVLVVDRSQSTIDDTRCLEVCLQSGNTDEIRTETRASTNVIQLQHDVARADDETPVVHHPKGGSAMKALNLAVMDGAEEMERHSRAHLVSRSSGVEVGKKRSEQRRHHLTR